MVWGRHRDHVADAVIEAEKYREKMLCLTQAGAGGGKGFLG